MEIQNISVTKEAVKRALTKVGLSDLSDRSVKQISGGQKQRIAIARALIKNPQIILADEPTGSLDSINSKAVFSILKGISETNLVVVVTHDMESAHFYGDKIIEIVDGQIEKIYDGGGTGETIRVAVNDFNCVDIRNYQEDLDSGKKILLFKPHKNTSKKATPPKDWVKSEVRLPFKSVAKLSLSSMSKKWAKTVFTILISAISFAVFVFSIMFTNFNQSTLYSQEYELVDIPYFSVAMHSIDVTNGVYAWPEERLFTEETEAVFDSLNLPHTNKVLYHNSISLSLKSYKRCFNFWSQYYAESTESFVELKKDVPLNLNLIAGRMPENAFEILITSYHMESYKMFGFDNGTISLSTVTDFTQIEGQKIGLIQTEFGKHASFTIVGVVYFDTDKYQVIKTSVFNDVPTAEEKNLLADSYISRRTHLNVFFCGEGFEEQFVNSARKNYIRDIRFNTDSPVLMDYMNFVLINNDVLSSDNVLLDSNVLSMSDFSKLDIVLSIPILAKLYPLLAIENKEALMKLYETGDYLAAIKLYCSDHVFGSLINATTIEYLRYDITTERNFDFRVVGVILNDPGKTVLCTSAFNDDLGALPYETKILPFNNTESRAVQAERYLDLILDLPYIDYYPYKYIVFPFSSMSRLIAGVATTFNIFIDVFKLVTIVMLILSILLVYLFMSQSINSRTKDIGILRSLGAKNKDIFNIFILEGAIVTLLECIFAIILGVIFYVILNKFLTKELGQIASMFDIISLRLCHIMAVIFLAVLSTTAATFFPLLRLSKKQPAEAIRS